MDLNDQKEQFSKAYVRAVVARGGYVVYEQEIDRDSVDLGIASVGGLGTYRSPKLELQLKCTSRDVMDATHVRFPLKIKNYDDLRFSNYQVPRILVVVVVPDRIEDWLVQSEDELAVRHCGYWESLRGRGDSSNIETVTIPIPRDQQFTVQSLIDMMERIRNGGLP
jgi:hypothetical protein